MGAIFRREVRSYFTSPIGYIFLAAFYAYSGVMFANYSLESGYTRLDSVFSALLIIIIVLIPVLTMRTISEEKRTKTDQCLLTAPVGLGSIVVGKFLAAFLIYIIAIAITGVFAVVVSAFGTAGAARGLVLRYLLLIFHRKPDSCRSNKLYRTYLRVVPVNYRQSSAF